MSIFGEEGPPESAVYRRPQEKPPVVIPPVNQPTDAPLSVTGRPHRRTKELSLPPRKVSVDALPLQPVSSSARLSQSVWTSPLTDRSATATSRGFPTNSPSIMSAARKPVSSFGSRLSSPIITDEADHLLSRLRIDTKSVIPDALDGGMMVSIVSAEGLQSMDHTSGFIPALNTSMIDGPLANTLRSVASLSARQPAQLRPTVLSRPKSGSTLRGASRIVTGESMIHTGPDAVPVDMTDIVSVSSPHRGSSPSPTTTTARPFVMSPTPAVADINKFTPQPAVLNEPRLRVVSSASLLPSSARKPSLSTPSPVTVTSGASIAVQRSGSARRKGRALVPSAANMPSGPLPTLGVGADVVVKRGKSAGRIARGKPLLHRKSSTDNTQRLPANFSIGPLFTKR